MLRNLMVVCVLLLLSTTTSTAYAQCVNGRCYGRSTTVVSNCVNGQCYGRSTTTLAYPTVATTGQQIVYVKRCVNGRCFYEAQVVGGTTVAATQVVQQTVTPRPILGGDVVREKVIATIPGLPTTTTASKPAVATESTLVASLLNL